MHLCLHLLWHHVTLLTNVMTLSTPTPCLRGHLISYITFRLHLSNDNERNVVITRLCWGPQPGKQDIYAELHWWISAHLAQPTLYISSLTTVIVPPGTSTPGLKNKYYHHDVLIIMPWLHLLPSHKWWKEKSAFSWAQKEINDRKRATKALCTTGHKNVVVLLLYPHLRWVSLRIQY